LVGEPAAVVGELRGAHRHRTAARIGGQHLVEQREVGAQPLDRLARVGQLGGQPLAAVLSGLRLGGRLLERCLQPLPLRIEFAHASLQLL